MALEPVHHTRDAMRRCIDNCLEAHAVCLEAVSHGLARGGEHGRPDHVRVLLDCAEMCATTADFMLRGSALHARVCDVCAAVCQACAEACRRVRDDPIMLGCAEVCRRSEESCREMAGGLRVMGRVA